MEVDPEFTTVNNRTGLPKTCKCCGAHIWWHLTENRWYNPGGEIYHIATCRLWKNAYRKREQAYRRPRAIKVSKDFYCEDALKFL